MNEMKDFVPLYDDIGRAKVSAPLWKLVLLGILAGFLIGCGALISAVGSFGVADPGLAKVVAGLLFPAGLIMVVLTGAELFTGNCLLASPLLRGVVTSAQCLRNLAPVYLGNCIGGALLAALCVYSGVYSLGNGALAAAAVATANAKAGLAFGPALVKGFLCNILVCAAVMFAIRAETLPGKALGAYLPVAVFVIAGFEHSIANTYYIPLGMLLGAPIGFGGLLRNLIPVTLGNLAGGAAFAALMAVCYSGSRPSQR